MQAAPVPSLRLSSGGGSDDDTETSTERCYQQLENGKPLSRKDAAQAQEFVAQKLNLDRYFNVLPLPAESRYRLHSNPANYDYFNGNLIDGGRYIATQAPTPGSIADFWLMVLETRARAIVMLTRLQEGNNVKATAYFPTDEGETITYGLSGPINPVSYARSEADPVQLIRIRCLETRIPSPNEPYTRRVLQVWRLRVDSTVTTRTTDLAEVGEAMMGDPIIVQHLWYEEWPDTGVPHNREQFLQLVQNSWVEAHPIVVHCSAGVGRTGAWLLLRLAIDRQLQRRAKDFCALLDELRRRGRRQLVSSFDQFQFVYDTYALYLQRQSIPALANVSCDIGDYHPWHRRRCYDGTVGYYYPCAYCGIRARYRCVHGGQWVPYCCSRCCTAHCQM